MIGNLPKMSHVMRIKNEDEYIIRVYINVRIMLYLVMNSIYFVYIKEEMFDFCCPILCFINTLLH